MSAERLRAILDAEWAGGQATAKASLEIGGVGDAADKAGKKAKQSQTEFQKWATGVVTSVATFATIKKIAQETYEALLEGAALEQQSARFDRLAESVGTTADAMLSKLRVATRGLVSDADLIAGASQIISLGLQDTEDGVVRLATLVADLGWDMQQVIMTFANDSVMRLDALGLSVTDVKERAQELADGGMAMGDAFDQAVIEAGELKRELLGIGTGAKTTAENIRTLQVVWENTQDAFARGVAQGAAEGLAGVAGNAATATEHLTKLANLLGQGIFGNADTMGPGMGLAALDEIMTAFATLEKIAALQEQGAISLGQAWQARMALFAEGADFANNYLSQLPGVIAAEREFEQAVAAAAKAQERHNWATGYYGDTIAKQYIDAAKEQAKEAGAATVAQDKFTRAMEGGSDVIGNRYAEAAAEGARQSHILASGLIRAQEETRRAEEAARALRVEYAGEFMTALNMADGETVNFTNTMLAAAAQGGANAETLALLAAATGEYSEEQIRAALETAAMTQKAQELGAEIAAGNITVGEALLQFQDFRAELEQAVVPEVDDSDVTAAIEEAERLRAALEAASGNWTATFNIVQSGGVPAGLPGVPVGAQPAFASGTGGWRTVPGPAGMPFPVTLHGGEMFNVVPHGQAAGGEGDTYNYYIYPTYASPTNEASLEADIRAMELLRA